MKRFVWVSLLLLNASCGGEERWEGALSKCGGARGEQDVQLVMNLPGIPAASGTVSQKISGSFLSAPLQEPQASPLRITFKADFPTISEKWDADLSSSGPGSISGPVKIDAAGSTVECTLTMMRK